VRIPWPTREYERTCDDCGCVWRVPKGIAHPHMQGLPMTRGSGDVATRAEAVAEANTELAERAAAFRRCPKCESDHYKQWSIRS
jgi:hypothetical protein